MADIGRLAATVVIWLALVVILIAAGVTGGDMVALSLILGIGATVSTGVIWSSGQPKGDAFALARKGKRTDRLSRLVDTMDEDEIYDLEDLLAARRDDPMRQ